MVLKLSLCVSLVLVLLAWESTSKSVIKREATNLNLSNISGVADSILKGGGELLTVVEGLHEKTKKLYAEQIKKTERILLQLQQGIDKLDEKHKTFAAEAMALVLDVKTTLRITRTDLNGIARRIISGMEELKVLAQAIFSEEVTDEDEINKILNWNVVAAKNMIKEGKEKIDQAQKDYEDVGGKLAAIEEKLIQYKQFIDAIVNSEHAEVQKHNTTLLQEVLFMEVSMTVYTFDFYSSTMYMI
jgi:exonuclease VII small subunit